MRLQLIHIIFSCLKSWTPTKKIEVEFFRSGRMGPGIGHNGTMSFPGVTGLPMLMYRHSEVFWVAVLHSVGDCHLMIGFLGLWAAWATCIHLVIVLLVGASRLSWVSFGDTTFWGHAKDVLGASRCDPEGDTEGDTMVGGDSMLPVCNWGSCLVNVLLVGASRSLYNCLRSAAGESIKWWCMQN
jgi:hypothetical protein